MKKYSGFTLIELMVVVAIIGIIGAIAFPSYDSYMKKSKRADAKVGLSKLADKQERFYLQNNTYATTIAALNTTATSDEGYYTLSIPSASATAFMLQAVQNSGSDTGCVTMTLSSTGAKEPNGDGSPVGDDKDCW